MIYPTVFKDFTTVFLPKNSPETVQVKVTDIHGKEVLKTETKQNLIIGNDLKSGLYVVNIYYSNKIETLKIMKE